MAPKAAPSRRAASNPRTTDAADGHYRAGLAFLDAHDLPSAVAAFESALADNPGPERQAAILFALANTARKMSHAAAAESFYHRVLAMEPGRIEAVVNLSNLLRAQERLADAQALLARALESNPSAYELWLSLGHVMRDSGDVANARTFFDEAFRIAPGSSAVRASLADLLVDLGDAKGALAHYDAALRREPGNARVRFHRALVLLSEGEVEKGFRDYAARFRAGDRPLRYTHGLKPWTGRSIPGKRLFITAEQGLGDQLIFARLIHDAIARAQASHVLIECEERLVPLFTRSFRATAMPLSVTEEGGQRVMNHPGLAAAGGADLAIEMGSLPGLMRLHMDDGPHAFLRADAKEARGWRAWLNALDGEKKVGICWRSGNMRGQRSLQFAPREAWAGFLTTPHCTLVNLQYDATTDEIAALSAAAGRPIHVPPALDQKHEIDRTAALITGLNAVVTAPTAVSAIAAAIGTPTFKLLYDRSWTGLGHEIEPLAPACRLIRPDWPGDWAQVFAKAREALQSLQFQH